MILEPLDPLKLPAVGPATLWFLQPSNQVTSQDQLNLPSMMLSPIPLLPCLITWVVYENLPSKCLPSLNNPGHASCEPLSSPEGNIANNNCINLLANKAGHDCEPLETNESIEQTNKFDTLLLKEQYDPCEDGENHEEETLPLMTKCFSRVGYG